MRFIIFILMVLLNQQCVSTKSLHILTIGDSNGANEIGWVYQLTKIRPDDSFFNCSIGGNTIGFDNLGKDTLNTLKNVNRYIKNAEDSLHTIDMILVMLGTNDCKAVFDSEQSEVFGNLDKLIQMIKNYPYQSDKTPEIVLISPPPIGKDSMLLPKYYGGLNRLEKLLPSYKYIAEKYDCKYIDIFHPLFHDFLSLTVDGIHLNEEGYRKTAEIIDKALK